MRAWGRSFGLLLLVACSSGRAEASGLLVGPFWMEGVTIRQINNDTVIADGGRWVRLDVSLPARGRMIVFTKPVQVDDFPTTASVLEQANRIGAGIILDGRLDQLRLTARVFESQSPNGNRLWIDKGRLFAELGRVTSGLQRIAGGTMDLAGSKLWVTNLTEFKSDQASLRGVFEMESWGRTLAGARIEMSPSTTGTATLDQRFDANIKLQVNMASGIARLLEADLLASSVAFKGEQLSVSRIALTSPELTARRLRVVVRSGNVSVDIGNATGHASEVQMSSMNDRLQAGPAELGWDSASGLADQTPERIHVGSLSLSGGTFSSSQSRLEHSGAPVLAGSIKGAAVFSDATTFRASLTWSAPEVQGLAFLFAKQGSVSEVSLQIDGRWGNTFGIAGSLQANAMSVGGVGIARPVRFQFPRTALNLELRLPLNINAPAATGSVTIADGKNTVMLTGDLKRLAMSGLLTIPLADPARAHFDVVANAFQMGVSGAVSSTPWLGSTRPMFVGAGLAARNYSPLFISGTSRSGLILIEADAMAISDPILQFGETNPLHARITLNATGGATIGYCMAPGTLAIAKASLRAAGSAFQSIDPGGSLEVGGAVLVNPSGSIADIAIDVDRLNGNGFFTAGALSLNASSVSRPKSPDRPNDVSFSGVPTSPVVASKISAQARFVRDQLEVTNARVTGFSAGVNGASVDVSQAISIANGSASLSGEEITSNVEKPETDSDQPTPIAAAPTATYEDLCREDAAPTTPVVTRQYFKNVSLQASGDFRLDGEVNGDVSAHLDNRPHISIRVAGLNGRSDRLNGNGDGTFSGFSGTLRSAFNVQAACENGAPLRIPMETRVATGDANLSVTLDKGKTDVVGALAGFSMAMNSTATAECHGPWQKHIIVARSEGWTEGICPTWSEPLRRCRWSWETPEVSYEYRSKAVIRLLTAVVLMSNPRVQLSDHRSYVCNVGPAIVATPLIVGGYYPEFRGNVPVISDIANALVGTTAEVVESSIAAALGTAIGGLATSFLNAPAAQIGCVLMGVTQ